MSKVFYFRQSNKHNFWKVQESFVAFLKEKILKSSDNFEVEWRPEKKKVSDNQRAYYFGIVLPAIQVGLIEEDIFYKDLKHLDADIRQGISEEFGLFVETENKITGDIYRKPISFSDEKGNSAAVKKYIDSVIIWAAREYGIIVPEPFYKTTERK